MDKKEGLRRFSARLVRGAIRGAPVSETTLVAAEEHLGLPSGVLGRHIEEGRTRQEVHRVRQRQVPDGREPKPSVGARGGKRKPRSMDPQAKEELERTARRSRIGVGY